MSVKFVMKLKDIIKDLKAKLKTAKHPGIVLTLKKD